ncbi:MAG: hypothetical protein PHS96_03950 [Anaerolineales bacterium]|nr:hypothetical protein [Anaerolineales bacterium]
MAETQFSVGGRKAMGILAIVVGLFLVIAAPLMIQRMLNETLAFVSSHAGEEPGFKIAVILLPIFMFIFRAIVVISGIGLIVFSPAMWRGETWAWPVALTFSGLPTITSVLFVLPYLAELGRPPITVALLFIGLATFWTFVLLKPGTPLEKLARFVTLSLLGMLPGHASILVVHGLKALMTNPDKPLYPDPKIAIFGFEGPINFFVMVLCALALYLVAAGKKSGWYLGLIAGIAAVVADYPTHFIRLETSDFLVGGTLGLLLAVSLLIPAFKERLVG